MKNMMQNVLTNQPENRVFLGQVSKIHHASIVITVYTIN